MSLHTRAKYTSVFVFIYPNMCAQVFPFAIVHVQVVSCAPSVYVLIYLCVRASVFMYKCISRHTRFARVCVCV